MQILNANSKRAHALIRVAVNRVTLAVVLRARRNAIDTMDTPGLDDNALIRRAAAVAAELKAHGRMLALAESCTGGWIAKVCTDLAGSSAWFERGLVTYSNLAKSEELGVSPALLQRYGAVSEVVAAAMARGARAAAHADWAIAVTGIAGPDGGSPDKPVGTVCFGWVGPDDEPETETCLFAGDRDAVRRQTVGHALDGLLERL